MIDIVAESSQVNINNCVFKGFPGVVIFNKSNGRHNKENHSIIIGNEFHYCKIGIYQLEEFSRLAHNVFQGCVIGVAYAVSNISSLDNKFLSCDVGVYIGKNTDCYGTIQSSTFVHCGIASIFAHLIPRTGVNVNDCFIYQAPIICKEAYALSFCNNKLNTYFIIEKGAKCRIMMNMMQKTYAIADGIENIYDVPADTEISLNRAVLSSDNDANYNRES